MLPNFAVFDMVEVSGFGDIKGFYYKSDSVSQKEKHLYNLVYHDLFPLTATISLAQLDIHISTSCLH